MRRRTLLQGLAGAVTAAPFVLRGQARKPNIVFLLSDDLGYADIGCFGARDIRTPHLDRLARDGMRLTDCYSNGAVCTPTRAAFLTGRYQQRFGKALEWALVPKNNAIVGLRAEDSVLPSRLASQGYRTGIFGKWHLGSRPEYRPNRHGFHESFGIYRGNADMYSHQYRDGTNDLFADGEPTRAEGYLTELIADKAVDFIRRNHAQPFFLYVPFNAVHWPFQAPGRPGDVRNTDTWTDGTRDDYRLMTESMDGAIGEVLGALRSHGVDDNTLVVFTNDNGGERLSDNSPYFHSKATLYEGGIRVPGIARWPGRIRTGSATDQACATMDFTASFLAAAGADRPDGVTLDGMNLLPVLEGKSPAVDRSLFWRIERRDRVQYAMRQGKWKYLREPSGAQEMLFELGADPGERRNVAYQHPERVVAMRKAHAAWTKSVDADAVKAGPEANNPAD